MKELILIRHSEHENDELTEDGKMLVHKLAFLFNEKSIVPGFIIESPKARVGETLDILNKDWKNVPRLKVGFLDVSTKGARFVEFLKNPEAFTAFNPNCSEREFDGQLTRLAWDFPGDLSGDFGPQDLENLRNECLAINDSEIIVAGSHDDTIKSITEFLGGEGQTLDYAGVISLKFDIDDWSELAPEKLIASEVWEVCGL